jgi:tetratricopeptide (TPR) repeat protein
MLLGLMSSQSSQQEDERLLSTNNYKYEVAKEVFGKLVEAKGDKRLQVPEFIMSKKQRYVAWMNGKKGQIGLEEKAYDICVSYGKDSLDAIAALLGHEVTHYYEKHNWGSEFASAYTNMDISKQVKSNSKSKEVKAQNETEADYLGGFLAHTAGYNTFGIMPQFLQDVYEAYGLSEEIPGYPSLSDRSKLAMEAEERMQQLVGMYKTANHMVVMENFDIADKYFGFILKEFPSREIYNNAGVNAAMAALSLVPDGEKESKFAYPLQLDGETRLDIKTKGDIEAFGDAARKKFDALVSKAVKYFEQAKSLDPKYPTAYLNLACAYDLQGEHEDAQYWAKKAQRLAKKVGNKKTEGDAKIMRAIASFHLEEDEDGKEFLDDVEEEMAFSASAPLAEMNKYIYENNGERPVPLNSGKKEANSFKKEKIGKSLSSLMDEVDFDAATQIEVSSSLNYTHKPLDNNSTITITATDDGAIFLHFTNGNYTGATNEGVTMGASRQDLKDAYGNPAYVQETRTGQYIVYKKRKAIFHIKNNQLAGWAVYRVEE